MKKANKMMALTMAAAMLVPQMAFAGESEQTTFNIFAGVSALSPDNSEKPLVQQMNDQRDASVMKQIKNKTIMDRLIREGYVQETVCDDIQRKIITEKGTALGLFIEKKVSRDGNAYDVLYYNEAAQRAIVDRLLDEWRLPLSENTGD